jgi:hypothetical protein
MELTQRDFDRIPGENLRVPRADFIAAWTLAERIDPRDWYAIGVRKTCRWVACATIPNPIEGGRELAPPPISATSSIAHEEAIQAEAQKADDFLAVASRGLIGPKEYMEAVASTLEWVWRGSGRPALDIHTADAG